MPRRMVRMVNACSESAGSMDDEISWEGYVS